MKYKKFNIKIIGGGLLGCLTALKLNDIGYKNVTIFDGKEILNGFDSIKIKNRKFNNGFHGIELPRAYDLKNYLEKKLNYKFIIKKNDRRIIIYNYLIKTNSNLVNWPNFLRKSFPKKIIISKSRNILFQSIKLDLKDLFKIVAKRYSKNLKDCLHQFVPWFLPNNLKFINNLDEGDKFREEAITKKLKTFYAFPKKTIFEEIKFLIIKKLNENKILLKEYSKVDIKKEKMKSLIVYCASSIPFVDDSLKKKLFENQRYLHISIYEIKNLNLKKFSGITEILCANNIIPEISRISFPKTNKKKYLQIESFIKNYEDKKNYEIRIDNYITNILSLKKADLNKIGSRITRKVFFPSHNLNAKCLKNANYNIKRKFNKNFIYKTYLGPINMSKTWIWSEEIVNEIKNYETR